MQISTYIVWYNGMAGCQAVSFVGDYLTAGLRNPHPIAFENIELYAHVPSKHVDSQLSTLAERFAERTGSLPKCWIKQKGRLLELAYNSKLGFAEDLLSNRQTPKFSEFRLACRETIDVLKQMRKKFVKSQPELFDQMLEDFERQTHAIPDSEERLAEVFCELRKLANSRLTP
jgi:hypothetical protein